MDFLSLPVVMIENIFSYLSYDEIAKSRLISKDINEICCRMLNRGFLLIERRHAHALKCVKAQLPRRESERKYHPLARHNDILTSIETRISMLNMTYTKFIDHGMCCFIPGKVIDEIQRVLHMLEVVKNPPRAHEALQELRDISSMAIEHFDDKISPVFRKRIHEAVVQPVQRQATVVLGPLVVREELDKLRRRSLLHAKCAVYLAKQYKAFNRRMFEYEKLAWRQRKTIREMIRKSRQTDNTIADLKKRIEECDVKYNELTHANQAVGTKAISASPPVEVGTSARHFGSQIKLDLSVLPIGTGKRGSKSVLPNIKPRNPKIRLPSFSEDSNIEHSSNPLPSTSALTQSPKTRSQSAMAKIRGLTNEIRQLTNLSNSQLTKSLEGKLKRQANSEEEVDSKKIKLD